MTDYGLTATGFNIKSLAAAKTELEQAFRDAFGAGIKLTPDTNFGKIIGILAEREASLWQFLEEVYDSQYPASASESALDRVGEITGILRNGATLSTVTAYLGGTADTTIPKGTLAAVQNAGDQFRTMSEVDLVASANLSISSITWDTQTSTATATSTAHGLADNDWIFIVGADQAEYNGFFQVANTATDSFDYTVTGSPVTPATGTIVGEMPTPVQLESVNTGPVVALTGTLNQIVNAISGWDRVENILDAKTGSLQESDADFRTRRIDALQGLGAARLEAIRGALMNVANVTQAQIFENDTDATDAIGRPPHSIEAMVVDGADQDIWDTLWDKKAAGIATFGDVSGDTTDSQGIVHEVNFTRPTETDIWVEVYLITNNNFPADGYDQVASRVLAWGQSHQIGQDVIIYPYMPGSFDDVPGIEEVTIEIGTAQNPDVDYNIDIADTEIAKFDSSETRMIVEEVQP